MTVAYIQIRKGQITSRLKGLGIKTKYHNKLAEIIKQDILRYTEHTIRNCGTAFILEKWREQEVNRQLNPQKRLT